MTYLDNGATSFPKAPGVGAAVAAYLEHVGVNINRSTYGPANDAAMAVLDVRAALKELFAFPGRETHVLFTPGATWGLNQILRGFLRPGDHVLVSSLEHNAVMRPLTELAEAGITFTRIPADRQGITRPGDVAPLLRGNTRLILVSHASNVCGTVFPLEETAALCREKGIPLAVDAAQTAGHLPIDFGALGLAALCVPGHKGLLGPQGIGALLLREDFAAQLRPICTGGTGSASDSEVQPPYLPDRFESGTQNIPGILGLGRGAAFVKETGVPALERHERERTAQFLEGLKGLPVRLAGLPDIRGRVGVISLDFPQMDNAEAAYRLESEFGVLTRCGLHCAPSAHRTLGTFPQGTVRFSLGWANTPADVDAALIGIRSICGR